MAPQDLDAFKAAFRTYAAGVSIITAARPDGTPAGFTATSLASLSAQPPMATFNISRTSSSWPAISESDYVALHLLSTGNELLARRMAGPADEKFLAHDWTIGPHELPIFPHVHAILIAKIVARTVVVNNASVAVEIEGGIMTPEAEDPLVYYQRTYRRLAAES